LHYKHKHDIDSGTKSEDLDYALRKKLFAKVYNQENRANANVSARQQCVYEGP